MFSALRQHIKPVDTVKPTTHKATPLKQELNNQPNITDRFTRIVRPLVTASLIGLSAAMLPGCTTTKANTDSAVGLHAPQGKTFTSQAGYPFSQTNAFKIPGILNSTLPNDITISGDLQIRTTLSKKSNRLITRLAQQPGIEFSRSDRTQNDDILRRKLLTYLTQEHVITHLLKKGPKQIEQHLLSKWGLKATLNDPAQQLDKAMANR